MISQQLTIRYASLVDLLPPNRRREAWTLYHDLYGSGRWAGIRNTGTVLGVGGLIVFAIVAICAILAGVLSGQQVVDILKIIGPVFGGAAGLGGGAATVATLLTRRHV